MRVCEVDLYPQPADSRGSGVSLNDEIIGHDDRGANHSRTGEARCRDGFGQIIVRGVQHGGCRPVLLLSTQHIKTGALPCIRPLVKGIENARADLDGVGSA